MSLTTKFLSYFSYTFAYIKSLCRMEELKVLNYSNVFIASYFTDNRECAHANKEHTLIYLCSGELEITEQGKKHILRAGECAFMRRDNRMMLQKRVKEGEPYRSVVLKFFRKSPKRRTLSNRRQMPKISRWLRVNKCNRFNPIL